MPDREEVKIETSSGECDVKIWCGDCERGEYTTRGDKYLCAVCGKILNLGHEVHHEIFPHVSGDEDHLS